MRLRGETVANVAVVVMSIAVTFTLVDTFVVQRHFQRAATTPEYRVGENVAGAFKDAGLAESNVTAVLIVNSQCHFCQDSAPFYRRLAQLKNLGSAGMFRTVVISSDGVQAGRRYASAYQIAVDDVIRLPVPALPRLSGTPTLLILDRAGRILGRWTGKLGAAEQEAVVTTVMRGLHG